MENKAKQPGGINLPLFIIVILIVGYFVWTVQSNGLLSNVEIQHDPATDTRVNVSVNSDFLKEAIEKVTVGIIASDNILYENGMTNEFVFAVALSRLTEERSVTRFNQVDLDIIIKSVLGDINYELPDSITYNCITYNFNEATEQFEKDTNTRECGESHSKYISTIVEAYREDNQLFVVEAALYVFSEDGINYRIYTDRSMTGEPIDTFENLPEDVDFSSFLTKNLRQATRYRYTFRSNNYNVYILNNFAKLN